MEAEKRIREIRSLRIDFDKGILIINGEPVENIPVIVTLPGPEEKFPLKKLFNGDLLKMNDLKGCKKLTVIYGKNQ